MTLVVKNLLVKAGDTGDAGSIPGSGRFPEEGNGNPFQYFCLGNPMTEEPGGPQFMEWERVGHTCMHVGP